MWIKRPSILSESGNDKTNFLFNEGKFYLMDNHKDAAWCWLQKTDLSLSYNFFHIDRHYDLILKEEPIIENVIRKNIKLSEISFDEYCDLKIEYIKGKFTPIFRFDNYIGNIYVLNNNYFKRGYYATHRDGTTIDNLIYYEPPIDDLDTNISYWINRGNHSWVLNFDVDYFFKENSNQEYYQFLTDEYIINVCNEIKGCLNKIEVVTIALSPEFCGGWKNSIRVAMLISEQFNLSFQIPQNCKF